MRRFLVLLLALLAVLALFGQRVAADAAQSEELLKEVIDVDEPKNNKGPQLSPETFAKIFEKLSTKCQKEIEANPQDPEKLSPRCGNELRQKVQRHLQREKEGPKEKPKTAKPQQTKPKKKKQSRAQREAAEQAKKDAEFMNTVTVIGGFVATLIAVAVGAMCFINRKLKAEGMYFPADPSAKADGCCG